jgi:hypothetical protein
MNEHNPDPNNRYAGQERPDHHKPEKDPFGPLFAGMILIVLGSLLFATTRGWLDWGSWWQYFLIGLGAIFLIDALLRYSKTKDRGASIGRVIPGVILIFIGLAFIFGFGEWWPLILIGVGISLFVGYFVKRQ